MPTRARLRLRLLGLRSLQLRMTNDQAKRIGGALASTPSGRAGAGGKSIEALEGGLDGIVRFMRRHKLSVAVLLSLCLALGACACRPGVIGPYGARPPRCWG